MEKITALLITISMIFSCFTVLSSCSEKPDQNIPDKHENTNKEQIIMPKGIYSRELVNYADITYTRPNIEATVEKINSTSQTIRDGASLQESIDAIIAIEVDYVNTTTMRTIAEIEYMKNSDDENWSAEYNYVNEAYPKFMQAVEDMLVACAQSDHRKGLEEEYFGYSLNDYVDGGIYTDRAIELMEYEARYEKQFTDLSEATVKILYDGRQVPFTEVIDALKEKHGEGSPKYEEEFNKYLLDYYSAYTRETRKIFLPLLRVRRMLADELGFDSYTDFAYLQMGYEYAPSDVDKMYDSFREYVYPVYITLYNRAFRSYFYNVTLDDMPYYEVPNALYELYGEMGGDISEAYSYMLECGLYDIKENEPGRYGGAFTTYIDNLNAPYVFMTSNGNIEDYLTLSHEYGHFLDAYINEGLEAPLDLSEISSQALELLTVAKLGDKISSFELQYLEYYQMSNALDVLLVQGLYSAFEHLAYQLKYDEITEANLNKCAAEASQMLFGAVYYDNYGDMLIQHTMVYPHYVQSYCTSLITSLEIYFLELKQSGMGVKTYLDLITRNEDNERTTFDELKVLGLTSPFDTNLLIYLLDSIHYKIIGAHYFTEMGGTNAA